MIAEVRVTEKNPSCAELGRVCPGKTPSFAALRHMQLSWENPYPSEDPTYEDLSTFKGRKPKVKWSHAP